MWVGGGMCPAGGATLGLTRFGRLNGGLAGEAGEPGELLGLLGWGVLPPPPPPEPDPPPDPEPPEPELGVAIG